MCDFNKVGSLVLNLFLLDISTCYPSMIRYEFADTIHKLGRTVSDKNILVKCLSLCLEELEAGGGAVPGRAWVGSKIPFLLLELDRDVAAYAFIKSHFDGGAKVS